MNMMALFFNLQIFVQTQYISLFLMNHIYRIPINNNYDIMDQNMNVCSTYIHTYIRAYIYTYTYIEYYIITTITSVSGMRTVFTDISTPVV